MMNWSIDTDGRHYVRHPMNDNIVDNNENTNQNNGNVDENRGKNGNNNGDNNDDNGSRSNNGDGDHDEGSDSDDDSDYIVDEDNIVEDVDVDMTNFHLNIDNDAEWLKKIPPQHWCRPHFSGRSHSDVLLNNMCEAFNSKLIDARDKPIITSTQWLEKLKTEANELRVIFCGNGKYQVTGQWLDQCVVDMGKQTCSCNRWELTGIPCKHAIAAIWEMRNNKEDVRIPESWVHPIYWLKTWKNMYSFTIEPINGRNMWETSTCLTTLLPPKHHVTIGRPKKKRKKSVVELEDLVRGHTASRSFKSVTCSKCKNIGHNSRSCKGQRVDGSQSSTGVGVARKRKGQNGHKVT
ncbi:hypothetical protein LXL04_000714 [Taraxacum kok-saghyz]